MYQVIVGTAVVAETDQFEEAVTIAEHTGGFIFVPYKEKK
jgi:hypothetical protein